MRKSMLLLCFSVIMLGTVAQQSLQDSAKIKTPRYTPTRVNNLVHTKLEVEFDYENAWLTGKAWITLTPHLYPTDSLTLDAKGMDLQKVSLLTRNMTRVDLVYSYNNQQLHLKLPKTYKKGEQYTVYIVYTSKPNEYEKAMGVDPMLGVKGLFFINPKGEDKKKPVQIWTQGETESNSVWFPTIDQTQQKTTQEIYMTVPARYVTLSNGKLVSQKNNNNGTRTDYWKMDLPHSPYLFYMGVGDYAVVKDSWKGKEVSYYVEKEYAQVAKRIFGNTPEMMTYFSRLTGIEYPWVKYSQITGRDFVAGAMENTTATMHQEGAQQDARELTDENRWEGTIAHELFHHWFGDYVTAESWSHLTVNESFADYSQTLWDEYKYGKDAGDAENLRGMETYLSGDNEKKDLVRFYYTDKEEMFDAVTYQKGGRILHMLRKHIGDSAFFKGINLYLRTNKFKSAETHHLRIAMEEISGQDLTWFFNQWYFGNGHPQLDIQYRYSAALKEVTVVVKQIQQTGKIFRIPTTVDVYQGTTKTRHHIWLENAIDSFSFTSLSKPDLINFDGDRVLLCEKKENKSLDDYLHQYHVAGNFVDRKEAVDFSGKIVDDPKAVALLGDAIRDPYHEIRMLALSKVDMQNENASRALEKEIAAGVNTEIKRPVKARMISLLGNTKNPAYADLYAAHVYDSSYTVAGSALEALFFIDSTKALDFAMKLSKAPAKGKLEVTINEILIASGKEEVFDTMAEKFEAMDLSNEKFMMMQQVADLAGRMKSNDRIKKAIDLIIEFRNAIPATIKSQTDPYINNMILQGVSTKLKASGNEQMHAYLESKK